MITMWQKKNMIVIAEEKKTDSFVLQTQILQ